MPEEFNAWCETYLAHLVERLDAAESASQVAFIAGQAVGLTLAYVIANPTTRESLDIVDSLTNIRRNMDDLQEGE